MAQPTTDPCPSAASVLFNLPDYHVAEVKLDDEGHRHVVIATPAVEAPCPDCGVFSTRVHQRTRQRLKDVAFDGHVSVEWVKKRWRCAEPLCGRATFTEHTEQVPPRARLTRRLREAITDAVAGEVRAVGRVATQFCVSWPTVQRMIRDATARLEKARADRPRLVRHLGIDEHRFRSVRWYKHDDTGVWQRIEPWMTTMVNLDTGAVIDVVDGRNAAAVAQWLAAKPKWWLRRVKVVAIDPSAPFRAAVRYWLPKAKVSVDHFHLVKLANDMVTAVRRRVSWDRYDRRGRKEDPAWAHRLLLLRGYDSLSQRGRDKLEHILLTDDPTEEIGAAWGIKEQLRILLACTTVAAARKAKTRFDTYIAWADLPEATRLQKTINAWWKEIEVFITTRVTNARTEAANVTIKNIKRTGRGYRSTINYRSRIMLYNATRSAA